MMPVIRLNDATFSDLAEISKWWGTKTIPETIDKVVKEVFEQLGLERDDDAEIIVSAGQDAMEFKTAPSLAFTKPLRASIDGKQVPKPRWSGTLNHMIFELSRKGFVGQTLISEIGVPSQLGQYEQEGFRYLPALGISVQGQSAADAWRAIERIATKWKIPVEIEFWWRQNDKAQHPGKIGIIRAGSK